MNALSLLPLVFLAPAYAHRPSVVASTVEVEDPTISWTFNGTFEDGEEVFTLTMRFEEPFALPVEVMSPARRALADHRPAFVIVGPGLPEPTDEERALLPGEVPEGEGIFLELNEDAERDVYFEGIMRRTLYSSGTTAIALMAGDYEVWIWSPDGTVGDFQFAFGVEENFEDGAWGPLFQNWGDFAW